MHSVSKKQANMSYVASVPRTTKPQNPSNTAIPMTIETTLQEELSQLTDDGIVLQIVENDESDDEEEENELRNPNQIPVQCSQPALSHEHTTTNATKYIPSTKVSEPLSKPAKITKSNAITKLISTSRPLKLLKVIDEVMHYCIAYIKELPNYETMKNDIYLLKQTCINVESLIRKEDDVDKKQLVLDIYNYVFPQQCETSCPHCDARMGELIDFLCDTDQITKVSKVKQVLSFLKSL